MCKLGTLLIAVACLIGGGCSVDPARLSMGLTPTADASRCVSLGSRMGLSMQVRRTTRFLVVSDNGNSSAVAARSMEQIADTFYASFARAGFSVSQPSEKLVCVVLDSYHDLDTYGRLADGIEASWMGGYYSYRTNRLALVQPGSGRGAGAGGYSAPSGARAAYSYASSGSAGRGLNLTTVTHELAHQLAFNCGLQNRNVRYPFWLTEGLATNFEADRSGAYGFGRTSSEYRDRLVGLEASGRAMSFERLVSMTQAPSGGDQAIRDAYAQAWGLFNYLFRYRRGQLRTFMTEMRWSRFDGQSLRSHFVAAFGPVESIDREFRNYVRALGRGGSI